MERQTFANVWDGLEDAHEELLDGLDVAEQLRLERPRPRAGVVADREMLQPPADGRAQVPLEVPSRL